MKIILPETKLEYQVKVGDLIMSNRGKSSQLVVFNREDKKFHLLNVNNMTLWQEGFEDINDLINHYHGTRAIHIIPGELLELHLSKTSRSSEVLDKIKSDNEAEDPYPSICVEDIIYDSENMITRLDDDDDEDEVDTQSDNTEECHDWEVLPYVYTTENYQLAITRKCKHCGISEKLTSDQWTPELLTEYAEAVKRRNSSYKEECYKEECYKEECYKEEGDEA